jgi:RNA polymerase sigma-70 factor (ECF subfamily)
MSNGGHRDLVDHLFRQEHGKMVAVLTRIFGFDQLEMVEDVVQDAYLSALRAWRERIPDNPSAWLMQAARNRAIDWLRRGRLEMAVASQRDPTAMAVHVEELFHSREISDSQLRLIFACCHPILDERDQIAFTLQLASGFSVREISHALVSREETIKKRLQRARRKIKEGAVRLEIPDGNEIADRLDAVLKVLYLTFNEGYHSTGSDEIIRRDLCAEAMRLTKLVCEHDRIDDSDSNALLALMCYHAARFDSRVGADNEIVLLADQDRSRWDRELIGVGNYYFARAELDERPSVYLLEAAIAAQHVHTESYENTPWSHLLTLYETLYGLKPTPVVWLNRIVVLAESGDSIGALEAISRLDEKGLVGHTHLYHCVCARVHERLGNERERREHLRRALESTTLEPEKRLINARLALRA